MTADPASIVLFGADGKQLTAADFRAVNLYGPGQPLVPWQTEPDALPWENQYPQGFNIIPGPRTEDPQTTRFETLRRLGNAPYVSTAIEYREKQVRATRWRTVPKDGSTTKSIEKFEKAIKEVDDFFEIPNRIDGVRFSDWIIQIVHETLVTDAVVLFRWPTRDGGGIHSLVQIDGSLIKPLISSTGHVVGYQQILYGYPSSYYPAFKPGSTDSNPKTGSMRYLVMNPRVDSVYGTPPLETIQKTILLAIKRLEFQLAWYTDGNVPVMTVEVPEGWSVDEIAKGQNFFDKRLAGDAARRNKMLLLPAKSNPKPIKQYEFSKEEEEAVISALCAHMGVPRHIFVPQVNRATAETAHDEAVDAGHKPMLMFLKDMMDDIIANDLGHPELERQPIEAASGTDLERAYAAQIRIQSQVTSIDEERAILGRDPRPPQQPALVTAPPPGPPQPGQTAENGFVGDPATEAGPKQDIRERKYKPSEATASAASNVLKVLGQWKRFSSKRLAKGRQAEAFEAPEIPPPVANMVRVALANVRDEAGLNAVFESAGAILKAQPSAASLFPNVKDKTLLDVLDADLQKKTGKPASEWDTVELTPREKELFADLKTTAESLLGTHKRVVVEMGREALGG